MEKDHHLQDSAGINAPPKPGHDFGSKFYLLKQVPLTHWSVAFSDLLLHDKKHPLPLLIACTDFSLEISAP